ncbi:hypothetical protein HRI_002033000 [Hibiscus trionum]|uniref:RNase H type-1 domain-containing protein n=1 Tax=Hibiscus trionum TaxID=183268 RepID=A0A9W7HVC1_HIBTR|nr:hypothetical protein HRI_002033000 [Hibiscus trionum]
MWGTFVGMSLAWELGFRRLVIESDILSAIQLANGSKTQPASPTLLSYIHDLCRKQWKVNFIHVRRNFNTVADCLAKMARLDCFDLVPYAQPPHEIQLLLRDEEGHENSPDSVADPTGG